MTFWIIVSIICILISILFYLSITQDTPNLVPNSDLEVYKDQLINVERDLSRGIITEDEAERIRAEVSRRILELDKRKQRSLEKETKVTGLIFSIVFLLSNSRIRLLISARILSALSSVIIPLERSCSTLIS